MTHPQTLDPTRTVAELVLEHSSTAAVFQRHRIDYCCRGGRSLEEACRDRGLDLPAVVAELDEAIRLSPGADDIDARELSTDALIDHVVSRHHRYLRATLPAVRQLAAKVARVHGGHNPKLPVLKEVVDELADTLEPHLDEEERSLFPALLGPERDAERIQRELEAMHEEHLAVSVLLERMSDATDRFTVPDWACTSYRTLFRELQDVETDLLRHVHLENHVLMPRFVPQRQQESARA